ncbi:hypothetical protein RIR_jg33300.t2 [Rhizophagus irregularis DAOM 181602=DAOM 197198]|nr:hypothetical protein RIR_jg33300.t2 [Rhizophagus irregularis DAOM 181602=DAOM 197198]
MIGDKKEVQDAHLEGRTPISKIQDVTEIRFKRKDKDRMGFRVPKNGKFQDSFGIWWASEERKTKKPRFVRSGGLPKKGKPRNQGSIWRASEERKTKKPRFVRSGGVGFRPSGKEEPRFVSGVSGVF